MTTLDQVEILRKQAVELLLTERAAIDEKLSQFGGAENRVDKKARTCSKCGGENHNAKTCKAVIPENKIA